MVTRTGSFAFSLCENYGSARSSPRRQHATGVLHFNFSIPVLRYKIKNRHPFGCLFFHGDPYGNRTHVTAVKGRCLNRLTNGPGSGDLT